MLRHFHMSEPEAGVAGDAQRSGLRVIFARAGRSVERATWMYWFAGRRCAMQIGEAKEIMKIVWSDGWELNVACFLSKTAVAGNLLDSWVTGMRFRCFDALGEL
jgi:hypothetical protein